MAENPFLLPIEAYQREVSPIQDAVSQLALYASKMLEKDYQQCYDHLVKKFKQKELPFHNPEVVYYERGENGDTERKIGTWLNYLKDVEANREIMVPTATTYVHPEVQESDIVGYIDEKAKRRKAFKKTSQKYEMEGDVPKYLYYHNLQDSAKRDNNTVSGALVAKGSLINNPTGHSTLTSITRSISSLSNASNERLISGNRHYSTPTITLNNLLAILQKTDKAQIQSTIEKFGLRYPSVQETCQMIEKSTRKYWIDRQALGRIQTFVSKLDQIERAAIVYTGDLYHIRLLNEGFMRRLIQRMSRQGDASDRGDPATIIRETDESIVNYAHQVCLSICEGIGKDYIKLSPEYFHVLANTCLNIAEAIEQYHPFFQAFFLTKNSPGTIATIPTMDREAVVLSDTDSTMFSVDEWVMWYFGDYRFTDEGFAVGGAVMFIATQAIAHILALFSANMNVERKRLFVLQMKPEYVFPVFAQTSVSKHYYTAIKVKEGNVYMGIKMEIKGVHMKDSSVPANLTQASAAMMKKIILEIMDGKRISIVQRITEVAALEREIERSIRQGEVTYLKRWKIKEAKAYKKGPEESPYQHYTFWQECLEPAYGPTPAPPFMAVRIPLTIANPSSLRTWLDQIPDQETAKRIEVWMVRRNRKSLKSIALPMEYCRMHGVPDAFSSALDIKKITLALTKSQRNVLESLGFFSKHQMLLIDQGY